MRRRDALAAGGLVLSLSAGCLETLEREDAWRELVVDPPDGVYVPPKVDEMVSYGTETVDGRTLSLAATRPHSFWTVTGTDRARADVRNYHAIHLMASAHDAETGTVVPTSVTTTIRSRDERVDERTLWPMLSQRMGFHYGDNVPLDGDGRYVATVRIEPTSADVADGLDDRLETATTVDLEFDYAADEIEGLERRLIDADEGRGDAGAVEPMDDRDDGDDDHRDRLEELAESWIGTATSGDLEFSLAVIEAERGRDVLAVLPRTRHNRYPIPFAALSVAPVRGGATGRSVSLGERLGADLGHHYGTAVERRVLEGADELAVTVDAPPQVSRHEGYETAFLDPEPATVDVDLE
ncbi:iron transporter [Natronococcus wangiae]|uniref:iron transporter n=1 Tax=Natronococcus wangiae TaxID=3068275 RepID=UPI00273ED6CE|nr:iron transporter [Natronococcus sp. AD5]